MTLASREKTIESLLNRLQSGDLKTLLSLQQSTDPPETPDYITRTDRAELEILSQAQGIGYEVLDDGAADDFDEFQREILQ